MSRAVGELLEVEMGVAGEWCAEWECVWIAQGVQRKSPGISFLTTLSVVDSFNHGDGPEYDDPVWDHEQIELGQYVD